MTLKVFLPDTPYYVYGLVDPGTKKIRYIGKTKNPNKRAKDHFRGSKLPLLKKWIEDLKIKGKEPIFTILETIQKPEVNEREKFYIEQYKDNNLFNVNWNVKQTPEHLNLRIFMLERENSHLKHTIRVLSGDKDFQIKINQLREEIREELITQFIEKNKNFYT